jgi:hypothetical protein
MGLLLPAQRTTYMTRGKTKTYMGHWMKTTLWLRIPLGPSINIDVWYPPGTSKNELVELWAKNASQGVGIIRKLTGTKKMVIQSQYEQGFSIPRGFNKHLQRRCRRILAVGRTFL